MVRVGNPTAVATFFSPDAPAPGAVLMLGAEAAAHARALRLHPGASVRVVDGCGNIATASIRRVGKDTVQADVEELRTVERGPEVHLLLPVGDKDRMLWLAEKSVEISLTSWRPVLWNRSVSVAGRGQGPTFLRRIQARMTAALEQCGGAWLPDIFPESQIGRAIAAAPEGARFVLDPRGEKMIPARAVAPVVLVLGPEGGMEPEELELFTAAQFERVRLPGNTLRFETAGVAALTLAHAALYRQSG